MRMLSIWNFHKKIAIAILAPMRDSTPGQSLQNCWIRWRENTFTAVILSKETESHNNCVSLVSCEIA